ncbi:right-handed parallel beta-helix repeat-containing protein [Ensifer adhaerens]|uniref:right-handed parallel beta-helix repeat-containing protein n=1 Tax=Ensifer canadensis TaxID=555315 RepID=UPI0014901CBF|nr:right-handed parallel beta-helix repeat-containing protein [Ensifer canadensis]NOV20956.1 right-handed parallel beta-helix repeat-containing protein [Ensifer canadensis]
MQPTKSIPSIAVSLILSACQSDLALVADAALRATPQFSAGHNDVDKDQSTVPSIQPTIPETTPVENVNQTPACASDVRAKLLASGTNPISFGCSLRLSSADVINHPLILEGSGASGAVLDCGGATIDVSAGEGRKQKTAIVVRSKKTASGTWDAPSNITVRNCKINGFVRIYGLGENANGEIMKASSFNANHTAFAQASAPKNVRLENMTIKAPDGIPLYVGPGVTRAALVNSRIDGKSTSVGIYLDAESANNTISDNVFLIATEKRELIAIDGSAGNTIANNTFERPENGGIFVYRNCGEGGVIRHQKPQFNQITGNTFRYGSSFGAKPAVWLNSRNGTSSYCFLDPAHPYGSSASNLDFAQRNVVRNNKLEGGSDLLIRNDDPSNEIGGNTATGGW